MAKAGTFDIYRGPRLRSNATCEPEVVATSEGRTQREALEAFARAEDNRNQLITVWFIAGSRNRPMLFVREGPDKVTRYVALRQYATEERAP